ncbi:MAG: hypothetical protein Q9218_008154, partial [Villophora microphyllina]
MRLQPPGPLLALIWFASAFVAHGMPANEKRQGATAQPSASTSTLCQLDCHGGTAVGTAIPVFPLLSHPSTSTFTYSTFTSTSTSILAAPTTSTAAAGTSIVPSGFVGAYTCTASGSSGTATACLPNDPAWETTVANWKDADVDNELRKWWTSGRTPGSIDHCESGPQLGAPDTSVGNSAHGLAQQLIYRIANVQEFKCTIDSNLCAPPDDPCQHAATLPRWAYLAWYGIVNAHQNLNDLYHTFGTSVTNNVGFCPGVVQTFVKPKDTQEAALQTLLGGLAALVLIAGVFAPELFTFAEAAEVGSLATELRGTATTEPGNLAQAAKNTAKANYADLSYIVPGTILNTANSIWERITAPQSEFPMQLAACDEAVVAIGTNTSSLIEQFNNHMFYDQDQQSGADALMAFLQGGRYIQAQNYTLTSLTEFWSTDIAARVINNLWAQYATYIAFTNLDDDATHTRCKADLVGPQSAKYCADGGVYYLYLWSFDDAEGDFLTKPWGFDNLKQYNIDPVAIIQASATAYRALGAGAAPTTASNIPAYDSIVETEVLGSNLSNIAGLAGNVPGEWTIPVCDQGYNHWGCQADNRNTKTSGCSGTDIPPLVPCACGPGGSETAAFLDASNIMKLGANRGEHGFVFSQCVGSGQNG